MLKIRDRSVYGCYIFLTCSFLSIFSNMEVVAADQSAPNSGKEYIYLPLALSIVPQVSSVEYDPNEVPHLSFNLLAGYYAKLDGFELGGLANLETEEVYGVQIALGIRRQDSPIELNPVQNQIYILQETDDLVVLVREDAV